MEDSSILHISNDTVKLINHIFQCVFFLLAFLMQNLKIAILLNNSNTVCSIQFKILILLNVCICCLHTFRVTEGANKIMCAVIGHLP